VAPKTICETATDHANAENDEIRCFSVNPFGQQPLQMSVWISAPEEILEKN
jgi:hypothetical protein